MWRNFTIFLVLVCSVVSIKSEGYYTIVGPSSIRANSEYHVSVSSHGIPTKSQIKLRIEGDKDYANSKDVSIDPFSTKLVQFKIDNILPGTYKLISEGVDGITFKNETEIKFNAKAMSVFIQTDKGIYKPGDTIRFRVVVLDANLKPADLKDDVNIFLMDGQGNRVKQWTKVQPTKGVFSSELELSSAPVLGNWILTCNALGETVTKQIEVAEYVLPKFEVTVDAQRHSTFKDGTIRATIRSKYTYGKPVKGEVTVSVYPTLFVGSVQPFSSNFIARKVVPIDGKATVEVDIVKELGINKEQEYERDVVIEAIVEETLTGRRQNGTGTVTLHKTKYKIIMTNDGDYYKPGLPFKTWVSVQHHDGTPVRDKTNKISIDTVYEYQDANKTTKEYLMDDNGMVEIDMVIPVNISNCHLNVKYLDADYNYWSFSKKSSDNDVYLQAKVKTENPTVNNDVSVEVSCTEKMKHITFQIIGRGDLLMSNTIDIADSVKHTFKFLASFSMVPKATLIVYFITEKGEIVSDKSELKFASEFQNPVKLELSTIQAKPGQEIDLTITTKPNSFIGLLGIDQSVLLLKKGNDFDKSEIFSELSKYNSENSVGMGYGGWGFGGRGPSATAYEPRWPDFDESGVVLMTNAVKKMPEYQIHPLQFFRGPGAGGGAGGFLLKTAFENELADDGGFVNTDEVKTRKEFPETWIWDDLNEEGFEGRAVIHKKVPDTITSWIITAFAVDPVTGFGMVESPKNLQVFQPFFVSTNLPYSIKRGEVVAIPIVVFNYMDQDVTAEVTLDNIGQEFEFTEISNEINDAPPKLELYRRKRITVKSNNGASLSFMIKPKKVGFITIKVTATSSLAGDAVERQLLVVPEGLTQYKNKAILVDLREKDKVMEQILLDIPKNAVPDSTRVEVSVVGDLFGPTIKNLDKLIRQPFGCGEQNMLNFVPNIVVLEYLTNINQLTPAIEAKAKKFMESGYQRELTYKHTDGSFSAFGQSDKSGSTWLTAFVARSFSKAARYIDIDDSIIDHALDWLSKQQSPNGSFPEVGVISHKDMQGGSGGGIALSAYTLITFVENKANKAKYQNTINKAIDYIVRNMEGLEDNYALALATYALQLADHSSKNTYLHTLDSKATTEGEKKWWTKPIAKTDTKNPYNSEPNSVNVEMSAYGLLAFIEGGLITDGIPIMKWLVTQRNSEGGFQSTQDTVVGLQALAKLGEQLTVKDNNVQVVAKYNENVETRMNVNSENVMIFQQYLLPSNVRKVDIEASGHGVAVVSVSYKYNMNVTGAWPRFTLDPQVNKNSNQDYLHLSVCTSFIPSGADNSSNMAVMEVAFPSGFTADMDTLPSLESSYGVKRVETKEGDTVVIMYFDNLDRNEVCPTLTAYRTHKVANQKPAPVTVYDYYDNTRRSRMFYKAQQSTLCDICEGTDCGDTCTAKTAEQRAEKPEETLEEFANKKFVESKSNGFSLTASVILVAICSFANKFL